VKRLVLSELPIVERARTARGGLGVGLGVGVGVTEKAEAVGRRKLALHWNSSRSSSSGSNATRERFLPTLLSENIVFLSGCMEYWGEIK
jgi:hypothetical protein